MATDKQIQYLTDLIETQKVTLQYGLPRVAARQFKKSRYPIREERRKMTREQRNQLDSELTGILSKHLDSLNPEAMNQAQASQAIDELKNGDWAINAISN